jgi:hypothetical protein
MNKLAVTELLFFTEESHKKNSHYNAFEDVCEVFLDFFDHTKAETARFLMFLVPEKVDEGCILSSYILNVNFQHPSIAIDFIYNYFEEITRMLVMRTCNVTNLKNYGMYENGKWQDTS